MKAAPMCVALLCACANGHGGSASVPAPDAGTPAQAGGNDPVADAGSGAAAESADGGTAQAAADAGIPQSAACGTTWNDTVTQSGNMSYLPDDTSAVGACGGGWCWENPLPFGTTLDAVAAVSTTEVWAGGQSAAPDLMRWDGTIWSLVPVDATGNVTAIWAAGPGDAWAAFAQYAGPSMILHWDGAAWTPQLQLEGVFLATLRGTSASDVWAAGADRKGGGAALAHWDGRSWTATTLASTSSGYGWGDNWLISSLWSPGGGELYAGGSARFAYGNGNYYLSSLSLQYDGRSWKPVSTPAPFEGRGAQRWVRTYYAGVSTAYLSDWSKSPVQIGPEALKGQENSIERSIHAAGPRVLGIFNHYRGEPGYGEQHDVWDGLLLEYEGPCFAARARTRHALRQIAGDGSPDLAWAAGNYGNVASFDGSSWRSRSAGTRRNLNAIVAVSDEDVWAAGAGGVLLHRVGGRFAQIETGDSRSLYALAASARNDVWAGGEKGALLHFDGASWRAAPLPTTMTVTSIFAAAKDDVWIGTNYGDRLSATFHWDGRKFTQMLGDGERIAGIWGSAADDVWVLPASRAGVHHWDGANLTFTPIDSASQLTAVTGSSRNDAWIADAAEGLFHWDGTRWSTAQPDGDRFGNWSSRAVRRANDVVLRGQGHVERFDGATLQALPRIPIGPMFEDALALAAAPGGTIWIAGTHGAILRSDP